MAKAEDGPRRKSRRPTAAKAAGFYRSALSQAERLALSEAAEMRGLEIPAAHFEDGSWLSALPALLALPRIERRGRNGAVEVVAFISQVLKLSSDSLRRHG